jgi:uncharacterized protein YndB with AHSA1/START domain
MKTTDQPILVEQLFEVSPTELWKAITQGEQMKHWFFENIETFEPKVGFETRFVVESNQRTFPHQWKIIEVEPLKRITYNWCYEGYDGDSLVTFELTEQGKNTRLVLTHTTTKDFPANIPEFTRESCIGGWNYFIKERLTNYLQSSRR